MTMNPEELADLKETFAYNDFDDDGRIEFGEFVDMLEQLDAGGNVQEARLGFDAIDTDDDGSIDFDEFVDWWRSR